MTETPKRALNIRLANPRGFCAGVDRAIEIVNNALRENGAPVHVRHEIVHNRHVVDELENKGAVFVDELEAVPDGALVVFSAHGVPKRVPAEARRRELLFADATCPLVSKVHREVERHVREGRTVLLVGHAGHPEVEGTMGQVPEGSIILVETVTDAREVAVPDPTKLAFATQTTLSVEDTAEIVATLEARFPAIEGPRNEDICYATTNRQKAVAAIAPEVDVFLVVGAPNSSNSLRLVEVAIRKGCPEARLVRNADDLPWDLIEGASAIGVTAGASAPEILVQGLIERLSERFETTVEEIEVAREDVTFRAPPVPKRPLPAA